MRGFHPKSGCERLSSLPLIGGTAIESEEMNVVVEIIGFRLAAEALETAISTLEPKEFDE